MKIKFEESLPDYEQYKNMSYVILGPKENSKKTPLKKSKKYFIRAKYYKKFARLI